MSGNICRCGCYVKIERAILTFAGGDGLMPRLVKTVTEMEGRFEEKWVLVEEDGIVSWDARRRAGAGRQARRRGRPAPQRVSGLARYTVDVALPGMLHAAVLRSPVAHGARAALRSTPPWPCPASAPCSAPRRS